MTATFKDKPQILGLVNTRWNFVHTESMSMAYFLDPRTKGGYRMVDCLEAKDHIVEFAVRRRRLVDDEEALKAEIAIF